MYTFFNGDVEISCDESVVRRMGETSKSAYAMMLIQMEANRSKIAPLCSGLPFQIGNNAMEERIIAIVKTKKRSVLAIIIAAVLVVVTTIAFATSAAEKKENNTRKKNQISSDNFTKQDYKKLLALQFDGYMDMSISAYRDKIWEMTDTKEYNDIIEHFFQNETLYTMYEQGENNEISSYLYNVLGPIMSDAPSWSYGSC